MMTIQEIESACDLSRPPDFSRHALEEPEASLREMFSSLGFPVEVRTNSPEILAYFGASHCMFDKIFDTEPVSVRVHVVESSSIDCPPSPVHRILGSLLVWVADDSNYGIVDLARNTTEIVVSTAALHHPLYLRYFFLEAAASCHISTRYTTPVHGACVGFDGRGVLLCGDSGAGKSTLSFACARAGWTFLTDDGSFLLNGQADRLVIGNCHQVRLRPSAAELFPEIADLPVTPRAEGKPSIEVPTASLPHIRTAEAAQVDFIVFLNRNWQGPPQLMPWRRDVARHSMRQVLFGIPELLAVQYTAIERLLTAEVFELRYNTLEPAIERLQLLVREGR